MSRDRIYESRLVQGTCQTRRSTAAPSQSEIRTKASVKVFERRLNQNGLPLSASKKVRGDLVQNKTNYDFSPLKNEAFKKKKYQSSYTILKTFFGGRGGGSRQDRENIRLESLLCRRSSEEAQSSSSFSS